MKLIVIHYHWRPCGVRKVVETALPFLARSLSLSDLVLVSGETIAPDWLGELQIKLASTRTTSVTESSLRYLSEQNLSAPTIRKRLERTLADLLPIDEVETSVVWAHNLGIGRNLFLPQELARLCNERQIRLILHHHDWWFDNRWQRWKEFRQSGFRTLRRVAQTVFPEGQFVSHVAINQSDSLTLDQYLPKQSFWWPNPVTTGGLPTLNRLRAARRWIQAKFQPGNDPLWIVPTRLLRRKNLAEALLLTRWLRPEAWLVTTGGISSPLEQSYAQTLNQAARKHRWRLHLSLLDQPGLNPPSVPDLLALSEVILLTSLQEGFGLPYLEASAAQRPLIARAIPNIIPDLKQFGFRFPQLYEEILVDPDLFDWSAEYQRQRQLYQDWLMQLPHAVRKLVGQSEVLESGSRQRPVPFSRLSLTAQIEVLSCSASESWDRCVGLNPFLREWRELAQNRQLGITPWPASAQKWLSGTAYARRFVDLLQQANGTAAPPTSGIILQEAFMQTKLSAQNLFPLLW